MLLVCLTMIATAILLAVAGVFPLRIFSTGTDSAERLIVIGSTLGACVCGSALTRYLRKAPDRLILSLAVVLAVAATAALLGSTTGVSLAESWPMVELTGDSQRTGDASDTAGRPSNRDAATTRDPTDQGPDRPPTALPIDRRTPPPQQPTQPMPATTTVIAPANPYLPAHGTLLLADPLTRTSATWISAGQGSGTCQLGVDGLQVATSTGSATQICRSPAEVTTATVEIEFYGTATATAGLSLWTDGTTSGYTVRVTPAGLATLTGNSGNSGNSASPTGAAPTPEAALTSGTAPGFNPAGWHLLALAASDAGVAMFVDRAKVGQTIDTPLGSGPIGVLLEIPTATQIATTLTFRSLRVWIA